MKRIIILLFLIANFESIAQYTGNLYDFTDDYQSLQFTHVEWLDNERFIGVLSGPRYVKILERPSRVISMDKGGDVIWEKELTSIYPIENQVVLDFQTDVKRERFMFVTRNEINDTTSQINLFLTDNNFEVIRDTSYLNHNREFVSRVKGRYDQKTNTFYGCGFSGEDPSSYNVSEFFYVFSEAGTSDTSYVRLRNINEGSRAFTDILRLDTGYISSHAGGILRTMDEKFNTIDYLWSDKVGMFTEGVNLLKVEDGIVLFSQYIFNSDQSDNAKPTLNSFDFQGNFLEGSLGFVGDDFWFPFEVKSMEVKNGNFYLCQKYLPIFSSGRLWNRRFRVAKYDDDMNLIWENYIENEKDWYFGCDGMATNDLGEVIAYGRTDERFVQFNFYPYLYLFDNQGELTNTIDSDIKYEPDMTVFPNPAKGWITVKGVSPDIAYKIFSITGQFVKGGNMIDNQLELKESGTYVLQYNMDDQVISKKIVVH